MSEELRYTLLICAAVFISRWIEDKINSMIGYTPLSCDLLVRVKSTGEECEATVFFCRECGKLITDIRWDRCTRCGTKIRWKGVKSEEDKNDPE